MLPFRLQLKYFAADPSAIDLSVFTGLFQRWIQQKALDDMLIDVADYRHVFEGPGIVLIGHESDYGLDVSRGRPGLLFTRKRQRDADLQAQLRISFRLALAACNLLESEPALKGKLKFNPNEVEIRFVHRLHFPNKPETFDLVQADLKAVLADVYGTVAISLTPLSVDPRDVFTLTARSEGVSSVADLLNHLQPSLVK